MDQENVIEDLKKETSEFQDKVRSYIRGRLIQSCNEMNKYHTGWEDADLVYRGYRIMDRKDAEATKKNEPPKIIIPASYALTQVALSYLMATFYVDDSFYRLEGRGPEDQTVKEGMETDLNYQMSKIRSYSFMYQWLQDSFKYGIGIVKSSWETEVRTVRTQREVQQGPSMMNQLMSLIGLPPEEAAPVMEEIVEEMKTFEGTKLINISPYNFYPDPAVSLSDFQKGSFIGHEEETTIPAVQALEGTTYYGTEFVPDTIPADVFSERGRRVGRDTMFSGLDLTNIATAGEKVKTGGGCILSELQFTSNKKALKENFGYDIGAEFKELEPVKMIATLANDGKVVQFQPLGYLHNQYSYDIIEYSPDHNNFLNPGLGDTIYNLQEMATWFLNSHVMNVRKAIRNRFIVDPDKIHAEDLSAGLEVIRTKNLAGRDIKSAVYSLEVTDVTRNHVGDMEQINRMMQVITGINANALGQFSTGRRSATEARNVSNSTDARLKMHGMLAWSMGLEPLGQKMIANTNQLRSREFYSYILGNDEEKFPYNDVIVASPQKIIGGYDFVPYDGTLPSDKQRDASHMRELIEVLLSNPAEISQLTDLSLDKLLEKTMALYGIKNYDDYKMTQEDRAMMESRQLEAQVVPDAMAQQLAQNPNAQQVPNAMGGAQG